MNLNDFIIKKPPKLKQCIPVLNAIFSHMDFQLPSIFNLTPMQLDTLFISTYGIRIAAPLLNYIHQDTLDEYLLTDSELTELASIILGTFKHKWDKYMQLAQIEYDPIHNYYDELVETTMEAGSGSDELTQQYNSTNTQTNNLTNQTGVTYNTTETTTYNSTNTETDSRIITTVTDGTIQENGNIENGIYGFNSSQSVGDTDEVDSSTTNNDTTVTETHSGNDVNAKTGNDAQLKTGTDTTTSTDTGTQANAKTGSDTNEKNSQSQHVKARSYKKLGNIGNLTTQQLIEQDLELWEYNFINKIFADVASLISLPVYY